VTLIDETEEGLVDLKHLEEELIRLTTSGFKVIGSFCAASNITGQVNAYFETNFDSYFIFFVHLA